MILILFTQLSLSTPPNELTTVDNESNGKQVYTSTCAGCHLDSGLGEELWFPPLINTPWVEQGVPLLEVMFRGVSGTIYVQEKRYASFMSPYGRNLTDDEVLILVKYIREELNQYPSLGLTTSTIASLREQHKDSSPIRGHQELISILSTSKKEPLDTRRTISPANE